MALQLTRTRVLMTLALDQWYAREVFRGAISYAHQHTNWQLVGRGNINAAEQRKLRPAGLLITGNVPSRNQWACNAHIPFVVIGSTNWDPRGSLVNVDDQAIGTLAAEYFLSLGLKHLAYLGHGPWPFVGTRLDSFAKAAEAGGCGPVQQLIGSWNEHRRYPRFERQLHAMLRSLPRPCGLLAADDALGAYVVGACRSVGRHVPDDIAVLGVNDDQLSCELSDVPLSSVAQPLFAIGYEAARLLHQHLEDPDKPPARLTLPPLRIVPRASSDLIALEDEDVVAALRLINFHFTEPINVNWVIRQLPVARRSLYRKFKALVGRTILDQIHHVRFQKAKDLLADSDLSMAVVAQRSGFINARWMAESFRRQLKITPHRFRQQSRTEA